MGRKRRISKIAILAVFCALLTMGAVVPAQAELSLTPEEQDYIAGAKVIRAASIHGVAPLHYIDSEGEITGIAVRILEEIADMTGLVFAYELYGSSTESIESGADILFSITHHYAPRDMVLSEPYLKSETILYINSSLDPNKLGDKTYAGLKGGALPEGVKEENALYYGTREESLNAVERGEADYGYGNAYSVAFYILQNDYKNIVSIPRGKEIRNYSIGFGKSDPALISIINKAILEIDEQHIHTLILDVASRVDRQITLPMIMESHGDKIAGLTALIVGVLLLAVIINIRANHRLKLQNKRLRLLSHISNECLFEYHVGSNRLELSKKCSRLFGAGKGSAGVTAKLAKALLDPSLEKNAMVRLPFASGETGVFKIVASDMPDGNGKLHSMVGKLIDVTAETAEKEKLITLSQKDGLTGLYNAGTTRDRITNRMAERQANETDALILLDCDDLKKINDTYGHLAGDEALKAIAAGLRHVFRETDIIGRVGGDEFCVYVRNISSTGLVRKKCGQLQTFLAGLASGPQVSVSIGVAFHRVEKTYQELFLKADTALYRTKDTGKGRCVIHGGEQITG